MQEFYTNTIESKMIKTLLSETYIPTVDIWKPGKPVVKGFTYVTKNYILKAVKDYKIGDPQPPLNELDTRYFKKIDTYVFGEQYKGITSNYVSNSSVYDPETHYYLGEYLRAYKEINDIDLMPFYNCWNGQFSDRIRLNKTSTGMYKVTKDNIKNDGLKLLLVPIKFNKTYTIYIDSNSKVNFYLAYCQDDTIIAEITNTDILKQLDKGKTTDIKYEEVGLTFNNPKKLTINITSDDSSTIENIESSFSRDYLTLLIQLPEINTSSVVVLEGDYTQNKVINIEKDNKPYLNKVTQTIIGNFLENRNEYNQEISSQTFKERYYRVLPKLTQVFNDKSYAFSNRLIEYLLKNVISSNEEITNNISEVQKYISSSRSGTINNIMYNETYRDGIWDDKLRKFIYDTVTQVNMVDNNLNSQTFDINGFIDKDSENIIMRGRV